MVILEARSNRVVERGREVIDRGDNRKSRPLHGKFRRCWQSYRKIGEPPLREGEREKEKTTNESYSNHVDHPVWTKLILMCIVIRISCAQTHEPFKWSLIRWEDQKVLETKITSEKPSFLLTLCDIIPMEPCLNQNNYYFCPSSNPGKSYCNYPGHYYCSYWGCETISSGWGSTDKFITTGWGPFGCTTPSPIGGIETEESIEDSNCDHIYINITNPDDSVWLLGKMWGARLYEPRRRDRGGHFLIKKSPIPNDPPEAVGPNRVINNKMVTEQEDDFSIDVNFTLPTPTSSSLGMGDDNLWKILQATFKVLNETHPNLTSDCWLCYTLKPPFYEAIRITAKAKRINGTNPARCL
ncbi:endogenous retrovirus group S71 member 1 Env polyprotein-like [Haemorhous mexicanus]|uniref:endogenous retrovirus group S71 member 1 Env polyprotein-like n=1 Tax=Haemorhous mexicanus TaxID=30427 RepID=UPI0028BE3809|nr:endogenous retrovirus group S71 member 1 Env polyprotein-like [Haemorhous mexicanus]